MRVSMYATAIMLATFLTEWKFPHTAGAGVVFCIALVLIVFAVERLEGPGDIGATATKPLTMYDIVEANRDQSTEPISFLPVYIAGIGFGINPATEWFTARVDGQKVLVLEHVKESDGKA